MNVNAAGLKAYMEQHGNKPVVVEVVDVNVPNIDKQY